MNKRQSKKSKSNKIKIKNIEDPRASITQVFISGYKSVNEKLNIPLSPLTVLAGTNSSGKSSFIQPLLLMKQTIEEGFDPGALLLNGPHVKFSSVDQILHSKKNGEKLKEFCVGFEVDHEDVCEITFRKLNNGFVIDKAFYKTIYYDRESNKHIHEFTIDKNTGAESIRRKLPEFVNKIFTTFNEDELDLSISRDRCFSKVNISIKGAPITVWEFPHNFFNTSLRNIIHLPGLRGNPERNYPTTAIDSDFESTYLPGNFEKYVASLINKWQIKDEKKVLLLEKYLKMLGLTNKVKTEKINDTQVSINVGRSLADGDDRDLVNIADVGLGVSQTLPVLVALIQAKPGQMVYIEQPEIHLHPKAQYRFAEILGECVRKGVRIVIETHSSLIIKGIQTAVAKKNLKNEDVFLHWFCRDKYTGETHVDSKMINRDGSFGDWPIDFDEVEITAEMNYLYATEASEDE